MTLLDVMGRAPVTWPMDSSPFSKVGFFIRELQLQVCGKRGGEGMGMGMVKSQ